MPAFKKWKQTEFRLIIIGCLLALAIFFLDLAIPLGVAGGVPYVAVVLLGLWSSGRRYVLFAALAGSVLTVLGYFLSPMGGEMWKVIFNRGLALFAIWATALLCFINKKQVGKLQSHEAEIEAILANVMDGIISINRKGIILSFNPAAEKIFGYDALEVIGKNVSMLMPEPYNKKHDGFIQNYLNTGIAKIIGLERRELEGKRKDGTIFPAELGVSEAVQAAGTGRLFIGTFRDLTEQKQVEEALRESKMNYQTIYDQMRSIVEGTARETGEKFFRSLVRHLAQALQCRYAFIGRVKGDRRDKVHTQAVWAGGRIVENFEYNLAGTPCEEVMKNEICDYPQHVTELFPQDHLLMEMGVESYLGVGLFDQTRNYLGIIVVMHDLPMTNAPNAKSILTIFAARAGAELQSVVAKEELEKSYDQLESRVEQRTRELKSANELLEVKIAERKRMEANLNRSKIELERSNQELNDFASIVSHDLQAPLRKILTFGDRLKEKYSESLNDEGRDYLDRMDKSTLRMKNYIENLLKLSRVTSKPITFQPVDLKKVVTEVVSDLEFMVKQANGTIKLSEEYPLPVLDADKFQMRQLFQNLISNALKFHKKGEAPLVKIMATSSEQDSDFYEIRVEDNGIGFDEKFVDRIMKPFERLHPTKAFEGTGLGLAICQRIIMRHGGALTATSASNVGSAFILNLPKKQAQPQTEPAEKN